MNPKIEELLKLLIEKGIAQDEIMQVRDDLLASAYESFMKDALQVLTDDDLKAIEASPTQEEANAALKKLYTEKSGQDSQAVMKEIVEKKADELILQYNASNSIKAESPSEQQDQADITRTQQALDAISNEPDVSTAASPLSDVDSQEAAKISNWQ